MGTPDPAMEAILSVGKGDKRTGPGIPREAAGVPVNVKNRYVSILAGDAGRTQAIRVSSGPAAAV